MLDQAVHQIARAAMRDVLDGGADIDHGIALQHAQLEIIEINQLHRVFPALCAELVLKWFPRRNWSSRANLIRQCVYNAPAGGENSACSCVAGGACNPGCYQCCQVDCRAVLLLCDVAGRLIPGAAILVP
jgi:hypothetical protein